MESTARKILEDLVKIRPDLTSSQLKRIVPQWINSSETELESIIAGEKRMFGLSEKVKLRPPAGLSARQAIPILIQYVIEAKGCRPVLEKSERSSFSALCEALDRQFGAGFAQGAIDAINRMPNGSKSLHYS
jgi:hypothetical protein